MNIFLKLEIQYYIVANYDEYLVSDLMIVSVSMAFENKIHTLT